MSLPAQAKTFGSALAWARNQAGQDRRFVGRFCGVDVATVESWESGADIPRGDRLRRIRILFKSLRGIRPETTWGMGRQQAVPDEELAKIAERERRLERDAPSTPTPTIATITPLSSNTVAAGDPPPPMVMFLPAPRHDAPGQMSFGVALRLWREQMDMLQGELADALGIAQSTISAWEREDAVPVLANLENIYKLLPELHNDVIAGRVSVPTSRDIPKPIGSSGREVDTDAETVDGDPPAIHLEPGQSLPFAPGAPFAPRAPASDELRVAADAFRAADNAATEANDACDAAERAVAAAESALEDARRAVESRRADVVAARKRAESANDARHAAVTRLIDAAKKER